MWRWEAAETYGVKAGFTYRTGGSGRAPYESMNLGLHVGDIAETVIDNRRRLCNAVGVPFEWYTSAEQVHGTNVAIVDHSMRGSGRLSRQDAIQDTDALISGGKDILLTAVFADCVPVWFIDPVHQAVAVAHAGWRGSVAGVVDQTVRKMSEVYMTKPSDLIAAIGPAIGACCYEVDGMVAEAVYQVMDERKWEKNVRNRVIRHGKDAGRWHLDLKQLNQQFMMDIGVSSASITMVPDCTSCDTVRYFSHRAEGGLTGRMAAWIIRTETEGGRT